LAPTEFVAARDGLAKRLKAEGDKEGGAAVKALRKPTTAAWAINQLARDHKADLESLLDLGQRMRDAQHEALTGGGTGLLKELSADRRGAVDALVRKAVSALGAGGASQRDAIVATLDAAVTNPGNAELVRSGRLAKELQAPSGFGDTGGDTGGNGENGAEPDVAVSPTPKPSRADAQEQKDAKNEQRRQRELDEKRGALRDGVEESQAAHRAAQTASDDVDRLTEALDAARARSTQADERVRLAERREKKAREDIATAETHDH
jgi:hypothetical protein